MMLKSIGHVSIETAPKSVMLQTQQPLLCFQAKETCEQQTDLLKSHLERPREIKDIWGRKKDQSSPNVLLKRYCTPKEERL